MWLLSSFPLDLLIICFGVSLILLTVDDFEISLILMELTPSILILLGFYWITQVLLSLSSPVLLFYSFSFLISIIIINLIHNLQLLHQHGDSTPSWYGVSSCVQMPCAIHSIAEITTL